MLKPVFGALADRTGPRPVMIGGLVSARALAAPMLITRGPAGIIPCGRPFDCLAGGVIRDG